MPGELPARYQVITGRTASRALAETLPLRVVDKYVEYKDGLLTTNPYKVSSWECDPPYEGYRSVRLVGEYRALLWIDDDEMTVNVFAIGRRSDIYNPGLAPS